MHLTEWFTDLLVASPQEAYDVLTAQRGPDDDNQPGHLCETKDQIVARLRGIVWELDEGESFPGLYMQSYCSITPNLIYDTTHSLHYYQHLDWAVRATDIHPVWNGWATTIRNQLINLSRTKRSFSL